ncbi:hypothetical protein HK096_008099, partial [Nowakowskiella sp. JEL0078]
KRLDHRFTNGMSDKKKHEVKLLSFLIHKIASSLSIRHILDFGAGQGYLDNILAFQYSPNNPEADYYTIIGADDSETQTCGARRRHDQLEKLVGKKNLQSNGGMVFHVNRRIKVGEDFNNIFHDVKEVRESSMSTPWLLCGLHTCGDLSPNIIRQFLSNPQAKAMVFVGCCYNHLTEELSVEGNSNFKNSVECKSTAGFPMSQFLKNFASDGVGINKDTFKFSSNIPNKLGFTARTLACQATCRWYLDRDLSIDNFSKHFSRAVLQVLVMRLNGAAKSELFSSEDTSKSITCLLKNCDATNETFGFSSDLRLQTRRQMVTKLSKLENNTDIVVGRLKRGALVNGFVSYARAALDRILGVDDGVSRLVVCNDALKELNEEFLPRKLEVAVLWTLRALLAEVIESLIFVDRILAIKEQSLEHNISVSGFPIFNYLESPRNLIIVAQKNSDPKH